MKNHFVNFGLAQLAKKKGFNEDCFGYYENQDQLLVINYNNKPLITDEQKKRPGLWTIDNRNTEIPQWATSAPTHQQLFDWFREKHKIVVIIEGEEGFGYIGELQPKGKMSMFTNSHNDYYDTVNETLRDCFDNI